VSGSEKMLIHVKTYNVHGRQIAFATRSSNLLSET
jgi:hypothetical protein